jgi:lipopolysaccharide exporter
MDDAAQTDRPEGNLTQLSVAGVQWSYIGSFIGGMLQLGMTALLARLLSPAAFGLVALAGLFLAFVDYFARAGVGQALIQKPRLVPADVRAAFTLSASLGALFMIVVMVAAPLAGGIADDPAVIPVLRWLAIILLLNGLGTPAAALLRRKLRFRAIALIHLASYVVGYLVVGLSLALSGAGVYALVGAMLTQMGVNAGLSYGLVRHPVRPTREGQPYRSILAFGGRVSIVGFFEFLQQNLDTVAVGRWAGISSLGLYNRARIISELPTVHLTVGMSKVLFPSFSAIQLEHERLKNSYISVVGIAAAIVLPLNAGMAVAAREIVLVVLGPQWIGAIEVIPWLLLASSITLLGMFAGVVAEARAALNEKLLVAICATITLALLLFIVSGGPLWRYGAALSAAAAISHAGYVAVVSRTLRTNSLDLFQPYIRSSIGAAIVAVTIAAVRATLLQAGTPTVFLLVAEATTGAVTLIILLRLGVLRPFRDDLVERLVHAGLLRTGRRMERVAQRIVGPFGVG